MTSLRCVRSERAGESEKRAVLRDHVAEHFELGRDSPYMLLGTEVRGEPILCMVACAYRCFQRSGMDALVVEHFVFYKTEEPPLADLGDWRKAFVLD